MESYTSLFVRFNLLFGEELVASGRFISNRRVELCYFGKHIGVELFEGSDEQATIFQGLVIEHSFDGENMSATLKYLHVEPDDEISSGFKQAQVFTSGVSMGLHSGANEVESFLIDEEFTFVFETKTLP